MKKVLPGAFIAILLAWCVVASAASPNLNLTQYRGKIVYLDFWASWCPPCRESFPWMNAMQSKYGAQGLIVIAVNVDEQKQDAIQFLNRHPADFKIVFDPKGILAQQYDLMGMPSSFLIDRTGHIYRRDAGFRDSSRSEYEGQIRDLLDNHPSMDVK
ncbi:MAG: TlpA disulfide reductase family protein [Gammaproteobacteria bacterium]